MAVIYTTQYQPISNAETCTNAALSVRQVRDTVDSLNNAKRYALCDKVLSHIAHTGCNGVPAVTDERVVMAFVPRVVPQGFTTFRYVAGHKLANGNGSTTWRLYCLPQSYRDVANIDTTTLPAGATNGSFTTDSSDHNIATGTLTICRGSGDECWFLLTAQSNQANSYATLTTLDAWPVML